MSMTTFTRKHSPRVDWHRLIYRVNPEEFRDDTRRAKDVIEQISGVQR
jgi:hypothetical protein